MRTPRCGVRARRTAVFAIVGKNRDRGGVSLAPPRRWIAEGKTEGLLRPYNACLYNPPASLRSAPSRAVVPALGQETARTMRRFQARKWSTPHCGVDKKAFARPLYREGLNLEICLNS